MPPRSNRNPEMHTYISHASSEDQACVGLHSFLFNVEIYVYRLFEVTWPACIMIHAIPPGSVPVLDLMLAILRRSSIYTSACHSLQQRIAHHEPAGEDLYTMDSRTATVHWCPC